MRPNSTHVGPRDGPLAAFARTCCTKIRVRPDRQLSVSRNRRCGSHRSRPRTELHRPRRRVDPASSQFPEVHNYQTIRATTLPGSRPSARRSAGDGGRRSWPGTVTPLGRRGSRRAVPSFLEYQATNRLTPSSIAVAGRKPTSRCRSSTSAKVAGTSPGCMRQHVLLGPPAERRFESLDQAHQLAPAGCCRCCRACGAPCWCRDRAASPDQAGLPCGSLSTTRRTPSTMSSM